MEDRVDALAPELPWLEVDATQQAEGGRGALSAENARNHRGPECPLPVVHLHDLVPQARAPRDNDGHETSRISLPVPQDLPQPLSSVSQGRAVQSGSSPRMRVRGQKAQQADRYAAAWSAHMHQSRGPDEVPGRRVLRRRG